MKFLTVFNTWVEILLNKFFWLCSIKRRSVFPNTKLRNPEHVKVIEIRIIIWITMQTALNLYINTPSTHTHVCSKSIVQLDVFYSNEFYAASIWCCFQLALEGDFFPRVSEVQLPQTSKQNETALQFWKSCQSFILETKLSFCKLIKLWKVRAQKNSCFYCAVKRARTFLFHDRTRQGCSCHLTLIPIYVYV